MKIINVTNYATYCDLLEYGGYMTPISEFSILVGAFLVSQPLYDILKHCTKTYLYKKLCKPQKTLIVQSLVEPVKELSKQGEVLKDLIETAIDKKEIHIHTNIEDLKDLKDIKEITDLHHK